MEEAKKVSCKKCGIEYELCQEYFYKARTNMTGYSVRCKSCDRARVKNYADKNKDKESSRHKRWREENRETYLEGKRNYRKNNKEKIALSDKIYSANNREKINKRERVRRKKDPTLRLRQNVASAIGNKAREGGIVKKSKTWNALPYTPQQLREHLENQFENWMNWDNYGCGKGKWNIDHIIPQTRLLYDDLEHPNFVKCWSLDNLRPLCSIENSSKNNKVIDN